jgi:hypothetical protein
VEKHLIDHQRTRSYRLLTTAAPSTPSLSDNADRQCRQGLWRSNGQAATVKPSSHALQDTDMNSIKILGIAILIAGVLGLTYGGFTYTKDTSAVKLGPVELNIKEKERVNIPLWAGIGAIVVGGLLLAGGRKG